MMRFVINPWLYSRLSRLHSCLSGLNSHARLAAIASTALLALAGAGGLASSAQAATYTVGTTEDLTRTCANPAAGTCSLRQLINYENELAATPEPPDAIVVGSGKYNLSNGALLITQTLVINGEGARTTDVDVPAGAFPVFEIKPPVNGGKAPTVVITGLEIAGGTASRLNGFFGGDIYNSGSLLLSEDWITAGTAASGGGISNDTGTLVLQHSLVSGNVANNGEGDSGAIQNHGSAVCGAACSPGKKAVLVVEDSTVAGNDARLGAGIFSWSENGVADGNEVSIVNSTIAYNNTREEIGGPAHGPGAGLRIDDGTAYVVNSLLAFNKEESTFTNCTASPPATIVSLGYNLESGTDCGFKTPGDLQATEPKFSSSEVQNNGGNTNTLALEPTSPGVDAIPANSPFCANTDQRGVIRPQGAGCDIGAFEVAPLQAIEGAQFSGQVATRPNCGILTPPLPTIEWGDGQTSQGTVGATGISGTHTYAEEGTFTGSVSYHNDCGEHKVAFLVNVADAPLTAAGVPVSATAGAQFSATVATFTDADPAGTASDYTTTINWGDGSTTAGTVGPAPGGGFAVSGSHTYANVGTYPTSATITDVGGAAATATSSANVTAPPPPPTPAAPTLLGTAPPSVLTSTSAVFTATVNPNGLPTTVHFEYGGVFNGASVAAIAYGSSTPNQSVPADFANHTVTATVTGLLPNVTYHVRAVATNSAGSALGPDQILQTPADPPPPPPVLGKTANVAPVSGIVYIELPPGATLASFSRPPPATQAFAALPAQAFTALPAQAFTALTKGRAFIPLTEARQIPFGSILDTSKGVARITTATTASRKGKLQAGDFGAGIFKLLQTRKQRGLTELNIIDNHSARQLCASSGKGKRASIAAKHPSSKVLGRLTANSHGHFTGRGQYSAATVRGTIWSVQNRCDGTLTRVVRGVLSVRDFRQRKTITLFTGQTYLARAPVKH
jgi:hypothetical protein